MLDRFFIKYPNFQIESTPELDFFDEYRTKAPKELVAFWESHGFGNYMNGYLKFVNPNDYKWLSEYIVSPRQPNFVVAITAFADVITWECDCFDYADFRHGYREVIGIDFNILFNFIFTDDTFFPRKLKAGNFEKAVKKLGMPNYNECFAYVPALALGGSEKIDNIKKVKLREHLEILTQLVGPL